MPNNRNLAQVELLKDKVAQAKSLVIVNYEGTTDNPEIMAIVRTALSGLAQFQDSDKESTGPEKVLQDFEPKSKDGDIEQLAEKLVPHIEHLGLGTWSPSAYWISPLRGPQKAGDKMSKFSNPEEYENATLSTSHTQRAMSVVARLENNRLLELLEKKAKLDNEDKRTLNRPSFAPMNDELKSVLENYFSWQSIELNSLQRGTACVFFIETENSFRFILAGQADQILGHPQVGRKTSMAMKFEITEKTLGRLFAELIQSTQFSGKESTKFFAQILDTIIRKKYPEVMEIEGRPSYVEEPETFAQLNNDPRIWVINLNKLIQFQSSNSDQKFTKEDAERLWDEALVKKAKWR